MRKIYPPPFNKFVVFVFYSLLSIAVIVSAQGAPGPLTENGCIVGKLNDNTNRNVVGYVRPDIDPNTIRWELYNYINIIGKKKRHSLPASFRAKSLFLLFIYFYSNCI
jgi:hypothetical protein